MNFSSQAVTTPGRAKGGSPRANGVFSTYTVHIRPLAGLGCPDRGSR